MEEKNPAEIICWCNTYNGFLTGILSIIGLLLSNTVILVLSEPCRIISREMLYTSLTRQTDKIVILYNKEPYHLLNYSSQEYSDIAKRFTDLFANVFDEEHRPLIVKVGNSFFEDGLIHRTVRGEPVRSKSEAIIANCLYYNELDYDK